MSEEKSMRDISRRLAGLFTPKEQIDLLAST